MKEEEELSKIQDIKEKEKLMKESKKKQSLKTIATPFPADDRINPYSSQTIEA